MNSSTQNFNQGNSQPVIQHKEDEIDLKVLLFNYLQYWPLILAFMVAGIIGAYLFNRYSTPIYNIQSSVLVKDEQPSLGMDLFESAGFGQGKNNIENEIGILKSYSLSEEAVNELNLNVQYFVEGVLRTTQVYEKIPVLVEVDWKQPQVVGGMFTIEVLDDRTFELGVGDDEFSVFNPADPYYKTKPETDFQLKKSIFNFGESISGENYSFKINQISALPGEKFQFRLIDTPSLALKFKEELLVSPINKQASILNLSLETPVRRLGEDYINKLMEMYLQRELDEKNRASESTVTFIDNQLSGITESLETSENRLQEYRTENNIFNLSEEGAVIFEKMQELDKERSQAELNLKYYQTLNDYLKNNAEGDLVAPSIIGVTDPLLNSLVESLSELQAERIRLRSNFSD